MKLKHGRSFSTNLSAETYQRIETSFLMIAILELCLVIKIPIVTLMTPMAQRLTREKNPIAVVAPSPMGLITLK